MKVKITATAVVEVDDADYEDYADDCNLQQEELIKALEDGKDNTTIYVEKVG
jgi:hypothetical protein